MQQPENVAIFWDFENLPPSQNISGYELVENVRSFAQAFGSVILFKAYLEVSSLTSPDLGSELQASGVSLTDCPHNGRKDVADKMLIADMVAFAIDHRTPATIMLISGDRDYAYAVSLLRLRKYRVVVACPSSAHTSLLAQASVHVDWNTEILGGSTSPERPPPSKSQAPSTSRRRSSSVASRAFTPSMSKAVSPEDDEDGVLLYGPPYNTRPNHYPSSARVNRDQNAPGWYATSNEPLAWRQGPSRTPSKPYSPPASFRSAKSSPPTPPPVERMAFKPTFVTDGDIVFPSTSKPSLPKGFPFVDDDITSQQAHQSITVTREAPALVHNPPLVTPAAVSPPLPAPAPAPAPAPILPPVPSPPPVAQKLHPDSVMTSAPDFKPTSTPAPSSSTVLLAPAPSTVTPQPKQDVKPAAPPTPQASKATTAKTGPPPPAPPAAKKAAVAAHFRVLISVLEARSKARGSRQVPRTDLGSELATHKKLYAQAGVSSFNKYISLAIDAGIVETGGSLNHEWVALRPEWASSQTFPTFR
ncbi:putative NYN domain containing protein [Lyophyllum shimeji]|uniref:NYN domain containing protein n=1 Tax=Lyophyllum shimeji TaxID=47721 RepID=A0A9P3PH27_LYOSH|nr:putative NYN domain containing protein [Lyophyllum shimeji]